MLALLFSLLVFFFFTLVGCCFFSRSAFKTDAGQCLFLSPVIGFSLAILLVSIPNYFGLPVSSYAWFVLFFLLPLAGWGGWKLFATGVENRKCFGLHTFWVFVFLVAAGFPMLLYGYSWIAYGNGDAAHFCNVAERLIQQPFFYLPGVEDFSGLRLTADSILHHTMAHDRFGTEEFLSLAACLSGLKPIQLYMPVLLACGAFQCCATAALIGRMPGAAAVRWTAFILLAASPQFLLGLYLQLLPQTIGLSMLLTLLALLTHETALEDAPRAFAAAAIRISLVMSAMTITYPELMPFAVLSLLLYWVVWGTTAKKWPVRPLALGSTAVACTVLFLNKAFLFMIAFMWSTRLPSVGAQSNRDLFPYFLLPQGVPALFGIQSFVKKLPSYWQDASILCGFLLVLLFLGASFWLLIRKKHPMAALALVMWGVGLQLWVTGNGFGTYKIAMYLQPALAGTAALLLHLAWKGRRHEYYGLAGSLILLFLLTLQPRLLNFKSSLSAPTGYFNNSREVAHYSLAELRLPPDTNVLLDVPDVLALRWASPRLVGHATVLAGRFHHPVSSIQTSPSHGEDMIPTASKISQPGIEAFMRHLWPDSDYGDKVVSNQNVALQETVTRQKLWDSSFLDIRVPPGYKDKSWVYVGIPSSLDWINKMNPPALNGDGYFKWAQLQDLRNHLVFIHSSLGPLPDGAQDRSDSAHYTQEKDIYRPGEMFSRTGDFLLFQVLNPSERFRLRISLTRTVNPAGHKSISNLVNVLGLQTVIPEMPGYGAATVVTEPLSASSLGSDSFIGLKLNAPRTSFQTLRKRLSNLYGKDLSTDSTSFVAYLRDLSILREEEYEKASPPTAITSFPEGLFSNPYLEFSGIYEDGWMSSEAMLVLGSSKSGDTLHLEFMVPGVPVFSETPLQVSVLIDGEPPFVTRLNPGYNQVLKVPVSQSHHRTRIHFRFDKSYQAPAPDSRVLTLNFKQIFIEEKATGKESVIPAPSANP